VRRAAAIALAAVTAGLVPAASAQPRRPATGRTVAIAALPTGTTVALAPLAALAGGAPARTASRLEAAIAAELTAAGSQVIAPATITAKVKAARQPALRACEGDDGCLADLGALVGAGAVVAGEVGGLGDVEVVYLELVDVAARAEVRRTQAPLGGGASELRAAVIRLVDPGRDVGTLTIESAIDGAVVFVDGRRIGKTPLPPMTLPVGAHALRVTHPDARDFVRFVDIDFERTTTIAAELQRFAALDTAIAATGGDGARGPIARGPDRSPAWYRRWWALAGFSAVVLGGAIVVGTSLADDVASDGKGTVDPP
jgi:hypothetical protein